MLCPLLLCACELLPTPSSPRDFFRFSKHGLRYLFEKTGFEVVELRALSGFWVTFGQLFVYNLHRFNRGPLRWLKIIDLLGLIVQAIVLCLDKVDRTERWTWMYLIAARKIAPTPVTTGNDDESVGSTLPEHASA